MILIGLFKSITQVYATPYDDCIAQALQKHNGNMQAASDECDNIATGTPNLNGYQLLAPLPCDPNANPPIPGCNRLIQVDGQSKLTNFDPTQPNNLSAYLNLMIKIIIGIAAVLSVIKIVAGGIKYMTTELVSYKEAAKETITQAVLGLLIALIAYALLFTINPDLLKTDFNPPATTTPPPATNN